MRRFASRSFMRRHFSLMLPSMVVYSEATPSQVHSHICSVSNLGSLPVPQHRGDRPRPLGRISSSVLTQLWSAAKKAANCSFVAFVGLLVGAGG